MSSMEVSFQLYLNTMIACNSMKFFSRKVVVGEYQSSRKTNHY